MIYGGGMEIGERPVKGVDDASQVNRVLKEAKLLRERGMKQRRLRQWNDTII